MSRMCPITHDFAPFDKKQVSDPYPFFNRLRSETPVAYSPELDVYLVTRFDDIVEVLKDRDSFSALNSTVPFRPVGARAKTILDAGFPRKPTFSNSDPPVHTAMRRVAARCLTRKRWAANQPMLTRLVEEKIDALAPKAIADLAQDLIRPVTTRAGYSLLGFGMDDAEELDTWCEKRLMLTFGDLNDDDQVIAAENLVRFWSYCRDFVRRRDRSPADDLTSDLIAEAKKEQMTLEDVDNMVYALVLASHETTANAMLLGLRRLLSHRDLWDRLVADRTLVPGAVEELLRFDSPTVHHRRLAKRNAEIAGMAIPAGATVMLLLPAGNHDPARFPDPERIDITRENAIEHLAFGKAWHFCMGAPLARFEYGLVLDRLLARTPSMNLVTDSEVKYLPLVLMRAPDCLRVHPNSGQGAA